MSNLGPDRANWWIDLVLERAAALRSAGVTAIGFDGCTASLLPAEPPPPKFDDVKNDDRPPDGLDALNDPHTYPGGIVPGFVITRETEE